jgi:hypothetical protein
LVQAKADAIERDIVALVERMLDPAQAWMQANAPWTDRTGQARANLYTDLEHAARQSVGMLLAHGPTISYSVYLETMQMGRFAILAPAVDWWAPVLFREVQAIVRRHTGG